MKVVRILVYRGDAEWLETQLGGSLPTGTKKLTGKNTIQVFSLPSTRGLRRFGALARAIWQGDDA